MCRASLLLLFGCRAPDAGPGGLRPEGSVPIELLTVEGATASPEPSIPQPGGVVLTVDGRTLPAEGSSVEAELIIVGGGPAGLAAAREAEAASVDWLLLEAAEEVGGALRHRSIGPLLFFAGTPEQRDAGITDGAAQLLEEWPVEPNAWTIAWAEDQIDEVYTWLSALGLRFDLSTTNPDVGSRPRGHSIEGDGDALRTALKSGLPMERLRPRTPVTGLLVDGFTVVGVDTPEGELRAKAVLLATGGFQRDPELVDLARPDLRGVMMWQASWPDATGDGHHLARAAGAHLNNMGAIGIYAHGTADPREADSVEEVQVSTLYQGTWLGQNSLVLTPEGYPGFDAGDLVVEAGGAWALLEGSTLGRTAFSDPMAMPGEAAMPTLSAALSAGLPTLHQHDSAAELALATGLDEEAVRASLTGEPPFLAVQVAPTLAKAFGGVWVNLSGQALRENGEPIAGLYAAGEVSGMAGGGLVGPTGHGFTGSLSAVIYSGRRAAWGALGSL